MTDENDERQRLADAYRATTYRGAPDGDSPFEVRIDEPAPVEGPLAYITSDNPGSQQLSETENRRRRISLRGDLRAAGLDFFPAKSIADEGDWPDEHGFWVRDIERCTAEDIARRYGQNAIVFADRNCKAHLVFC